MYLKSILRASLAVRRVSVLLNLRALASDDFHVMPYVVSRGNRRGVSPRPCTRSSRLSLSPTMGAEEIQADVEGSRLDGAHTRRDGASSVPAAVRPMTL